MGDPVAQRWRGCVRRRVAVLASVAMVTATVTLTATPAAAVVPLNKHGISGARGFDGCQGPGQQPTASQMSAWWLNTPYYDFYFYIGGTNNRAYCGPGGVNANWVNQVTNYGFSLVPIWVGPSGNCTTNSALNPSRVDCNASLAAQQARTDAANAYGVWTSMGFATDHAVAPVLDVEPFTDSVANRNAVKTYVSTWVGWWHDAPYDYAGAYGSSCGSFVTDWTTLGNVPDEVWLAQHNGVNSVWGISCVPDYYWAGQQRYHQWQGTHPESWNGVTLSIDTNCAWSWVAPNAHVSSSGGYCN